MAEFSYRIDALRNGVKWRTMQAVGTPQITAKTDSTIPSSLGGVFRVDPEVDLLNDELKAFQIIDGVEYPLGVFVCPTANEHTDEVGTKTVTVEAYDRCSLASQTTTEERIFFAAGTNYIDAIEQLLHRVGIVLIRATATTETLQTAREDWEPGTAYITIINTLLKEINYLPLHCDLNGYAVLKPAPIEGAGPVKRVYDELDPASVVMRPMDRLTDVFDAPNVFVAICENPELEEPLTAKAENNSPVSRLSIQARKRRIAKVQRVDNIASQAELNRYAQRLCYESMTRAETVTISTGKIPANELYDAVGLNLNGVQGIFTEKGWTVRLKDGEPITHTLERRVFI